MPGASLSMTDVLFWCRIPFTYGNVRERRREIDSSDQNNQQVEVAECSDYEEKTTESIKEEEEEEEEEKEEEEGVGEFAESTDFNGLISSIQMLISLVVIVSVLIIPSYTAGEGDTTSRKLLLTVLMVLGLLLMIAIYRYKATFLQPESPSPSTTEGATVPVHSDRDSLTLIGIVTFCALGCLYNLFQFMALVICSSEWIVCRRSSYVQKQIVKIVFCVTRIVYMAGQTVFCLVFNRSKFSDSSLTRHALMFLQAVNVILWFQALISEAAHLLSNGHDEEKQSYLEQICFANDTNSSIVGRMQCLGSNSTMYRFVHRYAVPILRPFLVEYSLLIGECLVHWFLGCGGETGEKNEEQVVRGIGHRSTAADDGDDPNSVTGRSGQMVEMEENAAGRVLDTDDDREDESDGDSEDRDEQRPLLHSDQRFLQSSDGRRSLSLVLCMGLAIACNLLLFVFAFLPKVLHDVGDKSLDRSLDRSYYYYTIVYYSTMIVSVALGYGLSSRFDVKSRAPFTGLDYLLIFTSFGPLAIGAFKLQAALWTRKRLVNVELIGAYKASISLEIIQSAFQVAFVLYAGRIGVERTREPACRRNAFRAIVFYLALCNGSLWCTNTFSVGSFGSHYLGVYFGETGRSIMLIVLAPLALFFRFNSCLLFARIFCQTKSKRPRRQRTRE